MKRKEFGSEFQIEKISTKDSVIVKDNIFSYLQQFNMCFFDSGRSALRAILKELKCNYVLLPDYICESVRNCFPKSKILYYHIDDKFQIDWPDLMTKCNEKIDILYLHYFNGCIVERYNFEQLKTLKKENSFTIIEDTTHSFLSSRQTVGDYCICSLRKWFPISDGGVLYSKEELSSETYGNNCWSEEKRNAMINKNFYLQGYDIEKNSFLSVFAKTEKILDEQTGVFSMSDETYEILKHISVKEVAKTRLRNYLILVDNLRLDEIEKVAYNGKQQVPLFCMVSVQNRNKLRNYLVDREIYCPIHWPLYPEIEKISGTAYKNTVELSIPIDQRYGVSDMLYISQVIRKYFETRS